jgi:poly(3-hydroxybutyrate) depolymerase
MFFAPLALAHLAIAPAHRLEPRSITEGLAIGNVSAPGRRPIPEDAVVDQLIEGKFSFPTEGQAVEFRGRKQQWRKISAGKDGWFEDPALENGYLAVQIDEPSPTDLILNAQGDSLVYVNGAPRAGDPYSYGYLNLPIHLNQGANVLLFVAGRGRISIKTRPIVKPLILQTEDATLPDLVLGSTDPVYASVVALNSSARFAKGLCIRARASGGAWMDVRNQTIPPYSARKLVCRVPIPTKLTPGSSSFEVQLIQSGKVLDSVNLPVQVKNPLDLQKRTFISQVDGSVQYFAVRPAAKPSTSNALVLTLHGASVEALGQAAAYAQKDWATIVAPTNRRPYGFDWEGIGREDALEVLNLAKAQFPYNPDRVDLTGHSMGGHGTWSIGTMYPGLFASIAPSAGWISFWSYAGGWTPPKNQPTLELLRRSMNVGDTLGRLDNTLSENVYILHGSADDNVPVEQAREMKAKLEEIHHPDLQYHEQPGAGHWWGNQCVDWPPIFQMIADSRLNLDAPHVDFTTQNPAVASNDRWVTILEQREFLVPSRIVADRSADGSVKIATDNVAAFRLAGLGSDAKVIVDGQPLAAALSYEFRNGNWESGSLSPSQKSPERGSGFKQVFNHRFLFVVGTGGAAEENDWALTRAVFFAETLMYRGNGAVDLILDTDYSPSKAHGRNVILLGNSHTNKAWKRLLGKCPLPTPETQTGGLLIYPKPAEPDTLVGAIFGEGLEGMRLTDRLVLFGSGVDYPDWIVFGEGYPGEVVADGFFDNRWRVDPKQSAQAARL